MPTILVKKKDGTFTRMTLEEIQKMKEKQNIARPIKEEKKYVSADPTLSVEARKEDFIAPELLIVKDQIPEVYHELPVPAISTPFNSFAHDKTNISQPLKKTIVKQNLSGFSSARQLSAAKNNLVKAPVFKLASTPRARPVINDIQPAKPVEMGPVDEIQYMTLTDFRRISAKPEEAAARLKQKFINLREESVLLYMQSLSAWRRSPLYTDYLKAVSKALKNRKQLASVLGGNREGIQVPELNALIKMESELE